MAANSLNSLDLVEIVRTIERSVDGSSGRDLLAAPAARVDPVGRPDLVEEEESTHLGPFLQLFGLTLSY